MKRILILITLILLTYVSYGQTIKINGNEFVFEEVDCSSDEFEPYMMLEISRGDSVALAHAIFHSWTGCNNESAEIGCYELNNNDITLYSFCANIDAYPIVPYQLIKKTYTVDKDGHITLVEGKMYLDLSQSQDEDDDESAPPMTKEEEEKMEKAYLNYMEQVHQATQVEGAERENLIEEVTNKLKKEIAKLGH